MLDHAGAVQHVVVSSTVWVLVAPLLLGLALHTAVYVYGRGANIPAVMFDRRASVARFAGLGCIGLVTGAALGHMLVLLRAPTLGGAAYCEYLASGIRLGGTDVNLVLLLDWVSAALCAFACALAFAVAVWVAVRPSGDRGPAVWACLELSLTGALVSFLADGLVAVLIGWGLTIAAGSWLAGWKDPRAGVGGGARGAAALLALLFGAAWLFWASAGTWDGREFSVRRTAGFSALASPPTSSGNASLTLTHTPGASVYLDEARAPIATAPFVDVPIPRGFHSIRVHAGRPSGEHDAELAVDVDVPEQGESIELVPTGTSLSLRDLGAALTADRGASTRWVPDAVAVTVVLSIWVVAAWLLSVQRVVSDAAAPLLTVAHGITAALIGPLWLGRASDLLMLAPRMQFVLPAAIVAILVAAMGALWAAASGRSDRRAIGAAAVRFERAHARLGLLLVRFEQWVIDAIVRATGASIRVAAWLAGRLDMKVLSRPGDAVAACAVSMGHGVESLVGMSIGRLAWALVGLAAAVVAAHGFWSNR